MGVELVRVYVAVCDGCSRELGQGYGHRETFNSETEARTAALHSGWSLHPDGNMYCTRGHQ